MRQFEEVGFAEAFYVEVGPGTGFAMMDATAQFGHSVELCEPSPPLVGMYKMVKNASENFDDQPVLDDLEF